MVPEVAEREAVEVLREEIARRLREQDLPAVARRRHARGAMHVDPDVSLRSRGRLTGVKPHTDPDGRTVGPGVPGERALRGRGSGGRASGCGERDKKRVTFDAELGSAVGCEGSAQDPVVVGEEVGPALVEPFGKDRRALDIREQEGDSATWRLHVRRA
ncbi:MAG TPA: hypothetical protein VK273_03785 [Gaiellaceae bacterium]|nr:hypothetical protein [Gaiellaceae bacterium]